MMMRQVLTGNPFSKNLARLIKMLCPVSFSQIPLKKEWSGSHRTVGKVSSAALLYVLTVS